MTVWKRLASINLSIWVIIGALLGILCGAFFGQYAAVLEPIGATYVMLLQMVVFPFLVSSLLHGLGSLTPATAWRLFKSGAPFFLLAWVVVFAALFLLTQAIPESRPPVVLEPGEGQGVAAFIALLVPSNPFIALTQNYVPAIVIFCIFYGIAIQGVAKKQSLLELLDAFRKASITIWGWVVKIAPFGVFALFADLAGTIQLQLIGSLLLYSGLFIGASLILALWTLPSLIAALSPVRYKDIMRELQTALVVAVVTSLPITAVPHIIRVTQMLVERHKVEDEKSGEVISTTMAVGYPIAQLGNLFVIFFIFFAAYYVHASVSGTAWLSLPTVTLLSTVGTPVSTVNAVSFIGQYLGMPADIKLLYVDLMTLTRYPQVLVSAMGLAFVTILAAFSYYGLLRISAARVVASVAISIALLGGLTLASGAVEPYLVTKRGNPYLDFTLDPALAAVVRATVENEGTKAPQAQGSDPTAAGSTMARVQKSGVLRVGFGRGIIPFSYDNTAAGLVGYDISLAYALARDLGVRLELNPITDWETLIPSLEANRFDLALGGIFMTAGRLRSVTASDSYLETPPALIVHAKDAGKFVHRTANSPSRGLKIAVLDAAIVVDLARRLFPDATLKRLRDYDALKGSDFDAAVWTLIQAKAWAEAHDGYTAVVPPDAGAPLSIGFLMPPDSPAFQRYVNEWLELQRSNGFRNELDAYWLEGKPRKSKGPRWSILRNVLGWKG
jgi:Na+/H+-dicarboxylate symporter/ABC-type amino acid transport substrate-binding protein